MKKYILISFLLFVTGIAFSQPAKKPAAKDKPPTQKEMDDMMKEMQQAMNEMSPEDKKMIDSMGIKMPSAKDIPKFNDKQLADAWVEEARLVPQKNVARIAAIPAAPTNSALPAFISKVHIAVTAKLNPAEKNDAEAVYQSTRQQPGMSAAIASIGFWIEGRPLVATYLMGKACQDEPGNINNINNYASMLTMCGAQQAAIPILQNLNKRFPNNSTLLNNLGQAWFGLGDIDRSGRYLDSAIRMYAYHSQANFTKSLIEESKGNTTAAIDALMHSIKKSHSPAKESRLKKLGKKLSGKDVDFPFPMPQDPLGLEKFSWPQYPMNVNESRLMEVQWDEFKEKCSAELRQLRGKAAQLEKAAEAAAQKRTNELMQAVNAGKMYNPMPFYAPAAVLKLGYLVDDKDGGIAHRLSKSQKDAVEAIEYDIELSKNSEVAEEKIRAKYDPLIGEGKPNPLAEYCEAINTVRSQYLQATNSQLEMRQKAMREEERKLMNDQVYFAQYINWPEEFEVIKVHAKMRWITLLRDQVVRFQAKGPFCTTETKEPGQSKGLQAFDDVACQYHSSTDLGIIEFNNDCSRLEGKFKLPFLKYSRKIDSDDHNKLLSASLEVIVGAGKSWEKGPIQAELKAEMRALIEWNDKQVTNWQVNSEVGASVGSNLGHGDKSIDIAGINAQMGMNTGSSVTGSGLLQNINISK